VLAENEEAIRLLERLGATRHAAGPEVRFEIDLSAGDDAGPTLRELLRAVAAALLAPARALLQSAPPDDG
jgi:hypothetical protein